MSSDKRKLEHKSVSKSLFELKAQGTLCDLELRLQGSKMLAHACVLASSSSYFHQLFQLNQEIHWCAKNRLVIDLQDLIGEDLCLSCVSKILDFMYLRELVIGKDHYEHLRVINNVLNVFDCMPLGKSWKKVNHGKHVKTETVNEQLSCKSQITGNNTIGVNSPVEQEIQSRSVGDHMTQNPLSMSKIMCLKGNHTGLVDSLSRVEMDTSLQPRETNGRSNLSLTNNLPFTPEEIKTKGDGKIDESKSSTNDSVGCRLNSDLTNNPIHTSLRIPLSTGNIGDEQTDCVKKVCEFMCCSLEPDINSSQAKIRKRRKMFCELCSFTSTCLRKVLQHLKTTNHLHSCCPICLRKINNTSDFKEHLKDHVNAKPFICQICNKRNRYWEYHKMHLKLHCRNKPFYCDLCRRGFVSKRGLTEHLATHNGSLLCDNCEYFTSDMGMYKSHLLQHGEESSKSESSTDIHIDIDPKPTNPKVRKLQCEICNEGFTQKKNLVRHVKLKHLDATQYKCPMCPFSSSRIDILRNHVKKKHKCSLIRESKRCPSLMKPSKDIQNQTDFVSVLIPVQLVNENHTVNTSTPENNGSSIANSVLQNNSGSNGDSGNPKRDLSKTDLRLINNPDNVGLNNKIQVNVLSKSHSFSLNEESSKENFLNPRTLDHVDISARKDTHQVSTEANKYIWLNESTGELLNDETLTSMQALKVNQKAPESTGLDFCNQFKSSLLNEASGERLDLMEDNEEWQFPQTPQANIVGIDDCDNLFPWNQIDNSFYSTWVLNETTGELNMVSFFSIQSVKDPELKISENSNSLARLEDDDTALFLNEGTGDLSVIYFNPNRPESLNVQPCEKTAHDNLETLSDISDDDSNFLNEEFMRVSANFMSNEENEKFLNELTGEFDIANMKDYPLEILNNQVTGDESYLNEETGEISHNMAIDSVNNDLFSKPEGLEYDLDDSLNCEDFESFFRGVSDFPTEFSLDDASKNWQSAENASDALVLNECTGELVKRS